MVWRVEVGLSGLLDAWRQTLKNLLDPVQRLMAFGIQEIEGIARYRECAKRDHEALTMLFALHGFRLKAKFCFHKFTRSPFYWLLKIRTLREFILSNQALERVADFFELLAVSRWEVFRMGSSNLAEYVPIVHQDQPENHTICLFGLHRSEASNAMPLTGEDAHGIL